MSLSRIRPPHPVSTLVLALALSACGRGRTPVPQPGSSQGTPPDLRGSIVMVLPFQSTTGIAGDADAELAFALRDRAPGVTWVLPPRLQQALDRSPGLQVRIHGLQVGVFSSAEVERVGDPLFGDLLRLGSLVDAEAALVPLRAWTVPGEGGTRVLGSAALIHVRTGRVLWFGVVEGTPAEADDPAALASAVDALARTLLWYGR
ncbi:MAG: hypothetical protein FIA95_14215 [Gemmatimonadetes bacterium]|nr:hypothetical protein [Gemmatimonadota bacterium]